MIKERALDDFRATLRGDVLLPPRRITGEGGTRLVGVNVAWIGPLG
jgi:hypothetical protein